MPVLRADLLESDPAGAARLSEVLDSSPRRRRTPRFADGLRAAQALAEAASANADSEKRAEESAEDETVCAGSTPAGNGACLAA